MPYQTILPILATTLLFLSSFARMVVGQDLHEGHVRWIRSYNEARELGRESNRPVFMFLTTGGCRHCVRMERESFKNAVIAEKIESAFVPSMLHIDPESELAEKLKVTIFPTTLIIHPNGKILTYARGYMPPDQLRTKMDAALADARLADESAPVIASNRQ